MSLEEWERSNESQTWEATKPMLKQVGDEIRFGKRRGHVVAHATFKRYGHAEPVQTYYVVELDPESAGYLEPIGDSEHDNFISMMLVNVGNED